MNEVRISPEQPPAPDPEIVLRHEPEVLPTDSAPGAPAGEDAKPRRLPWGRLLVGLLVAALAVGAWQAWQARQPVSGSRAIAVLPGDAELMPPGDRPVSSSPFAASDTPQVPVPVVPPAEEVAASLPSTVPDPAQPLPALADSDGAVAALLADLAVAPALSALLAEHELIRRLVATVDALPSDKLSLGRRVLDPVPGRFLVREVAGGLETDPANAARYAPLVAALTALPPVTLATAYRRFYPLLQQAYADLGYPEQAFHVRVLEVIDHLLAAGSPPSPIALIQPKVFYRYADQALEKDSAGRRALYRLDPAQREQLRAWLGALRAALVSPAT